jgi:hydrogenase nickel incorporation protein HypA/HybF
MEQIEHIAHDKQADHVLSIHLGIGPLSTVEPRLLEQAFFVARTGMLAASAELEIESIPVRVSCKQCGKQTDALPNRLLCGSCGDWRTSLVSGDELLLQHVELLRQESAEPEPHVGNQQYN